MKTSDFSYDLPQELIAQTPIEPRDSSRLMTLDKHTGETCHRHFYDIADLIQPGDCLILNDSRVLPARIYGVKEDTGAHVEFLLLENKGNNTWEVLCKPGKRAKEGSRFTFGGGIPNKQEVYFFNLKEIMDNKFGTATPIPYQDWSHPVPNQMTGGIVPLAVKVKCYGKYTFRISNPAVFLKEISGTADVYKKDDISEQMRTEVMSVFQNVLNELGTEKYKIPVLELPSQTDEIKQMMDEKVFDEPIKRRGLSIVVFAVESVTLDEKSEKYIQDYILSSNANLQQGKLTDAYAEAIKSAAENESGSMNGFMGIGMMNMAGSGVFGNMGQNISNNLTNNMDKNDQIQVNSQKDEDRWKCTKCGTANSGKFCTECGNKKETKKVCTKCGREVEEGQKFCPECGEKIQ